MKNLYIKLTREIRKKQREELRVFILGQQLELHLAQKKLLKNVFEANNENVTRTAASLGMWRTNMNRLLINKGLRFINIQHQKKVMEGIAEQKMSLKTS